MNTEEVQPIISEQFADSWQTVFHFHLQNKFGAENIIRQHI